MSNALNQAFNGQFARTSQSYVPARGKEATGGYAKIPSNKLKPFITLIQEMMADFPTQTKALSYIGISGPIYRSLVNDGVLTVRSARIILQKHKEWKK